MLNVVEVLVHALANGLTEEINLPSFDEEIDRLPSYHWFAKAIDNAEKRSMANKARRVRAKVWAKHLTSNPITNADKVRILSLVEKGLLDADELKFYFDLYRKFK